MLVLSVFLIVCLLPGAFSRNGTYLLCLPEIAVQEISSFKFCFMAFIIASLLSSNREYSKSIYSDSVDQALK